MSIIESIKSKLNISGKNAQLNQWANGFFKESNRPLLFILGVIFVCGFIVIAIVVSNSAPSPSQKVNVGSPPKDIEVDNLAEKSEAFKAKKRAENERYYKAAINKPGGVNLPFQFNEKPPASTGDDMTNCNCRAIDDEELQAALTRLGYSPDSANQLVQVSGSQIYIGKGGFVYGADRKKLLYKGKPFRADSNGQLLDENNVELTDADNLILSLSKNGEILNANAQRVPLNGSLKTSTGIVVISNGYQVNDNGNMKRIAETDLYISVDGQLITLDGRPVLHSGSEVFRDSEMMLINLYNAGIEWNSSYVYQNLKGHLVDTSTKVFKTPGILFSYSGILIDNLGKLTQPLLSISRVGDSDIYVSENDQLYDESSKPLNHYGQDVFLGLGGFLVNSNDQQITNRMGAPVSINDDGRLTAPIAQGGVQSGIIRNNFNINLDMYGHLLNRHGKLQRKGSSYIHTSFDGLLTDSEGRSILYKGMDIFLDYKDILKNEAIALSTVLNKPVLDLKGQRVYLSSEGYLINSMGNQADLGVSITNSYGVVLNSNGELFKTGFGLIELLTSDGSEVYFKGAKVHLTENSQLVDAQGNPILDEKNRPLYMNSDGVIVDDYGNVVHSAALVDSNGNKFTSGKRGLVEVLAGNGEALLINGKPVFRDKNNNLVFSDGTLARGASGETYRVDSMGRITNSNGDLIDPSNLNDNLYLSTRQVELEGKKGLAVLKEDGTPMLVDGKEVFTDSNGNLFYSDGSPVTDKSGRVLKRNKLGQLTTSNGVILDPATLAPAAQVKLGKQVRNSKGQLITELLDDEGNQLKYDGKSVFKNAAGQLSYEDGSLVLDARGQPLEVDSYGNLLDSSGKKVDPFNLAPKTIIGSKSIGTSPNRAMQVLTKSGEPLLINGEPVFKDKFGNLLRSDGSAVRDSSGDALMVNSEGLIVNDQGEIIDSKTLGKLAQLKEGKEFIALDGRKLREMNTANGSPLLHKGRRVYKNDLGGLVYDDGSFVVDESGLALNVDKNGNVINSKGEIVDPFSLVDAVFTPEPTIQTGQGKATQLLDSNGASLLINGKEVFKDEKGNLVFSDGQSVSDLDGNPIRVNSEGQLINEKGEILNPKNLKATAKLITGKKVINSNGEHLYEMLDARGEPIYHNGQKVFKNKEGELVYQDGTQLKDESGSLLSVDSMGNVRNSTGKIVDAFNLVEPLKLGEKQINLPSVEADQMLDESGQPILINGEKVYKTDKGNLIYADGSAVRDSNGSALRVNDEGLIIDEYGRPLDPVTLKPSAQVVEGKTFKTSNGDYITELTDTHGKPIFKDGKRVFKNKNGKLVFEDGSEVLDNQGNSLLVDSHGNILNKDGVIVDPFNKTPKIKNGTLTQALPNQSALQVFDENGQALQINGKPVFKDGKGNLMFEDGTQVVDAGGNPIRLNSSGNIVDNKGQILDPATMTHPARVFTGSTIETPNGETLTELLDSNGKHLARNGKKVYKTKDGKMVYQDGSPVLDDEGKRVTVDELGNIRNETGDVIDLFKQSKRYSNMVEPRAIPGGVGTELLDSNGKRILVNGKPIYKDKNGNVVFENGDFVTDVDGSPLKVGKDNKLVNQNGEIIESNTMRPVRLKTGRQSTTADGQVITEMLKPDGSALMHNGQAVFKNEKGQLTYQDGSLVLGENGQSLTVDKLGNVRNSEGEIVDEFNLVETIKEGLRKTQLGTKYASPVLDENGSPLKINGRSVFKDEAGNLIYADGNTVTDPSGLAIRVNKSGKLVNSKGEFLSPKTLLPSSKISEGNKVIGDNGETLTQMLDANGNVLTHNGEPVFKNEKGQLVYNDGRPVISDDGELLFSDLNGNVVNADGRIVDPFNQSKPVSKSAKEIKIAGGIAKQVMGTDGNALLVGGQPVYKDAKGNLVYSDGSSVKDKNGSDLHINADGNLVNSSGAIIDPQTFEPGAQLQHGNKFITKAGEAITELTGPNGKSLFLNGKQVYSNENGMLVDSEGEQILDENGEPLRIDAFGNVIDSEGRIVDPFNQVGKVLTGPNEITLPSTVAKQVLDASGNPLLIHGQEVYEDRNGNLIDSQGTIVRSIDGEALKLNSDGVLVDRAGNAYNPKSLKKVPLVKFGSSDDVNSSLTRFKAGSNSDTNETSNFSVNDSGYLLGSDGKPILYNNKAVTVGKNGQLYNEDGSPVLDINNKPVYLSEDGASLVDANGKPSVAMLTQGDNVIVDGNGNSLSGELAQVGESDLFVSRQGALTDKEGKQLYYKGTPVRVDPSTGKLVDLKGNIIRDDDGNEVFISENGELINKLGERAKISLTDSNSRLIESNGRKVTKLTNLGNGYYKTAQGQIVDSEGKPISYRNKSVYIDDQNTLTDSRGRPVIYGGRSVGLGINGELVDSQGQPVNSANGEAIELKDLDTSINVEDPEIVPEGQKREVRDNTAEQPKIEPAISTVQSEGVQDSISIEKKMHIPTETLDYDSIRRVNRRYEQMLARMEGEVGTVTAAAKVTSSASNIRYSSVITKDDEIPSTNMNDSNSLNNGKNMLDSASPNKEYNPIARAGDNFYAYTTHQVNTDYNPIVELKFAGVEVGHELRNAIAYAAIELKFDKAVLKVNRICPVMSPCKVFDGLALDPSNASAGLGAEVDEHLWYRYGGLFFASLLQGASTAVSESVDTTETIGVTGSRVTTSGLEGKKLVVKAGGEVGNAFAPVFAQRISRPITVKLPKNFEMAIKVLSDFSIESN